MPTIRFDKGNRPDLVVGAGVNLMRALLDAGLPVASSCHGDGVCAKCRLKVSGEIASLSVPNETELFLKERFELGPEIRISCQTLVLGDVTIDASYW